MTDIEKQVSENVMYVMSMPRQAFTDNMFCLMNAVYEMDLYGQRQSGVFWNQGIENLLENAIEKGFKYALTIDYDTYYTKYHIIDLYNLMEANPDIGVLLPLQPRRGNKYPMAGDFKDPEGHEIGVYLRDKFVNGIAPTDTGHFGLTLIRLSELKKLKKPWLNSYPNKDGSWGRGHKDADVAFWIKCKNEGVKVALAEVWIGHIQLMCSWTGSAEDNFFTHYMYVNDVLEGGMPKWTLPKSYMETEEGKDLLKGEHDMAKKNKQETSSTLAKRGAKKAVNNNPVTPFTKKINEKVEQYRKICESLDTLQGQLRQAVELKTKLEGAIAGLREAEQDYLNEIKDAKKSPPKEQPVEKKDEAGS